MHFKSQMIITDNLDRSIQQNYLLQLKGKETFVGKNSLKIQQTKPKENTRSNISIYNGVLPEKYASAMLAKVCGIKQLIPDLIQSHSMRHPILLG